MNGIDINEEFIEPTWDEFVSSVRAADGPAVFVRDGVRLMVGKTKDKPPRSIGPVMREIGAVSLERWPYYMRRHRTAK